MQPNTAEFLAGFDLAILDAAGRNEAHAVRDRLLADPGVADVWHDYQAVFGRRQRLVDRLYHHQQIGGHGTVMGGKLDLYRVFAERMVQLPSGDGAIGMVVPSAFHANEGATGIRKLYLDHTRIEKCLSFENRKGLFDIHGRYKFALVVARRPGPTCSLRCGFYLTGFHELEEEHRWLVYDRDFIAASGGAYATLLELRDPADLALARRVFLASRRLGQWMDDAGIVLSREIHMSDDASRFTLLRSAPRSDRRLISPGAVDRVPRRGYLLLHEGKTLHQFSDRRETLPRYAISLAVLADKPMSIESALYYRAACREIARSTDERTAIATLLPPGVLCGHTISVERKPARRPNAAALLLVGVMNSFAFDWLVRQKAAIHVSLYILSELPAPQLEPTAERLLAHGSLRLCCNHRGFAPLWQEQFGEAWRESLPRGSWPVLAADVDRWRVRASMDAVVAYAYSLNRAQYERILASFSHKSFPAAPALCLAAFDELVGNGLAQFCRDHDPYFDIALVTSQAQRVLHLPKSSVTQRSLLARAGSLRV